jgi:hypothetical protein
MRAPAAVLAEITWRWTFGVAFWAILYYSFREYFASIEISNAEHALLRGLEPYAWIAVSARVFVAFVTGLRALGPIIIPALSILWIALSAVGRAATVRALSADQPRTNWASTVGLQVFRVLLTITSVVAYFGCGILINNLLGDTTQNLPIAVLLSVLALTVIALIWSVVNWFTSIAVIFTARDHESFTRSLADTSEVYHRNSTSFFSSGFSFGLIRSFLVIAVTIVSIAAMTGFSTHPRFTLIFVVAISLAYFALADAINLWRLATYVSFTEPHPEPSIVAPPTPVKPATDLQGASALYAPGATPVETSVLPPATENRTPATD